MAKTNYRSTAFAQVENGRISCPRCGAQLARAYYGASGQGIELWCRSKNCHMPVRLEL